jgi:hypothetical protein
MSEFEELKQMNSETADALREQGMAFNVRAADLLLQNALGATEQLTPQDFRRISPVAARAVVDAAILAEDIAPLDDAHQAREHDESDDAYQLRQSTSAPLDSLHYLLSRETYEHRNYDKVNRILNAVHRSSQAFSLLLDESERLPIDGITIRFRHFYENAEQASQLVNPPRP